MSTKFSLGLFALSAMAVLTLASANVQASQNSKNDWRNLTILGVAVAAVGALNHNSTAVIAGTAAAVYSDGRYQQDSSNEYGWGRGWGRDGDHRRYDRDRDYRYDNHGGHRDWR